VSVNMLVPTTVTGIGANAERMERLASNSGVVGLVSVAKFVHVTLQIPSQYEE
jgi:hypothetical protein